MVTTSTNQNKWTDIEPRVYAKDQSKRTEALKQVDVAALDPAIESVTKFLDSWLSRVSSASDQQEKTARKALVTNVMQEIALKQLDLGSGTPEAVSGKLESFTNDVTSEIIHKLNAQYGLDIKTTGVDANNLAKELKVPPQAIKKAESPSETNTDTDKAEAEKVEKVEETKSEGKTEKPVVTLQELLDGISKFVDAKKDGNYSKVTNLANGLGEIQASGESVKALLSDTDTLKAAQSFIEENFDLSPDNFKEALAKEVAKHGDNGGSIGLAVKFLMLNASGAAVLDHTLDVNRQLNNAEKENVQLGIHNILQSNPQENIAPNMTAKGQKLINEFLTKYEGDLKKADSSPLATRLREEARNEFLSNVEEAYNNGDLNKLELRILVNNFDKERVVDADKAEGKKSNKKGLLDHIAPGKDFEITGEQMKTVGTVAAIGIAALFFIPGVGKMVNGLAGMAATLPQLALNLWDQVERIQDRRDLAKLKQSQVAAAA